MALQFVTSQIKDSAITNAKLAGSIADSKLSQITTADKVAGSAVELAATSAIENSSGLRIASTIAGVALSLSAGQELGILFDDSSIGVNGSDELQVKDSGITNAMLAGSIANAKLSNSSVSFGGISLALGASDATPAFDLSDATNYPTSSLSGTITNAQLAGSIANAKLANDSVTIAGNEVDLGASLAASTLAGSLALSDIAVPSGAVSLNSQKITNLADPVASSDAANKSYVDGVAQGLDVKDSVRVATTGNITLSGTQTIDGVAVIADDRVLVKDQSTASQNGIYICKADAWVRPSDFAAGEKAAGAFMFVEEGTVNADAGFVCTNNGGSDVIGTNDLSFTQFSGAGQIDAGAGLAKSGNTLSVNVDDSSIEISSDSLQVKALGITNAMLAGSIANAKLANSTISGVALGGTLSALTDGNGIADFSYDGSGTATIAVQLDGATLTSGDSGLKVSNSGVDTDQLADDAVILEKFGALPKYEEVTASSTSSFNLGTQILATNFLHGGNVRVYLNGQRLQYKSSPSSADEYKVENAESNTVVTFGAAVPDGSLIQVDYFA